MKIIERKPNHVPPHIAGYIDELESDRKTLAKLLKKMMHAYPDGTHQDKVNAQANARAFLLEIGEGECD